MVDGLATAISWMIVITVKMFVYPIMWISQLTAALCEGIIDAMD